MYGTRWLKKFCKGDESLEDEGCSGQPLEFDNNQLRGSLKLILIQLHKKLPKNSGSTILWSAGIWSKLERWKSLISGCLMSWRQIKIIVILKCGLLILCNNKPFLDWIVACDEKWILYDNQQWPAQWLDREEAPEHFLKPKLHPKKGSWSLSGGLLPLRSITALNPGETVTSENWAQQVGEMRWRLHQLQQFRLTGRAQFSSMTTLHCAPHSQRFRRWATKAPVLTNKGVFEPTYNDLKFMIQNRNHVCTNLIQMKIKWRYVCPLAYIILFCFTLLCLQIVSFLQTEGLWQLYLEEVYWCQVCQLHLLTSCLLVRFW